MGFGGGSTKIQPQSAGPSPYMFLPALMSARDPVTSLPSTMNPTTSLPTDLVPNAPAVLTPDQLMGQAAGVEGYMANNGLGVTAQDNPFTFGQNAAQNYANQYFNMAIQPQLGDAAIQQYMAGNFGNGGDTFGSNYLASLANQGAQSSFFAGQQYRDDQINNLLSQRNAYFGQDVALPQQQNAADIQRALTLNDQATQRLGMLNDTTTQRLGMLNNYQLGFANLMQNSMDSAAQRQYNTAAFNANQNFMGQQAGAANLANLAGGIIGGGFGLGNALIGRSGTNNLANALGGSSAYSAPMLLTPHAPINF